ncbi:hypothetical protein QFC21_005519 [Naganishia friedmannii]|uniref:Uncharacterized protein n=1 Tax=Naganishia friedmannii TaxID=89922 RepID=A0ACC2V8N2_9TREE|nr:hypothetical protein QFC21_005519 [Naganishia friedmannii]
MCEEIKRQGQIIYGILKKEGWKYWQEEELLLRMKLQTLPRKHGSDFSMGLVHLQRACQHIYTALVTARQTEQQYDIVLGRVARQLARNIIASEGDGNIEEGVMDTSGETDSVALSDEIHNLQPEHYLQYHVEENPDDFAHSHAAYTKDDSGDSRSNFGNFEEEGDLSAHPERALLLSPKITSQSDEFIMTSVHAEQVIECLIELFQYAYELQRRAQIYSDIPEKTKSLEQKILSVLEEAGYAGWDVKQASSYRATSTAAEQAA